MSILHNRLADSASLYLRQHADNPVHWQPWDERALALARELDRPILLSIGYASCHWCHVMEAESFADPACAAEMNATFVPIKVDREERPDLDAAYMLATLALCRGQGGWPMTVFLAPSGWPFFAGTYFPPTPRQGMPSFRQVLRAMGDAWQRRRGEALAQADGLVDALRASLGGAADGQVAAPSTSPPPSAAAVLAALASRLDPAHGGFGGAPKFPPHAALEFLVAQLQGAKAQAGPARRLLDTTLCGMRAGGMHDLVGGGFARYSVDGRWFVPHFEKMLADNALLARTYLWAGALTGEPSHTEVGLSTLAFMRGELGLENGLFAASLDADDPGGEGAYYSWTPAEVAQAVGAADAPPLCAALGITEQGNWEGGRSLPRLATSTGAAHTEATDAGPTHTETAGCEPGSSKVASFGVAVEPVGADHQVALSPLARGRRALAAARVRRAPPPRDPKAVVGHQGLAISALATGARLAADRALLAHGERAADTVWARAWDGLRLFRLADGAGPKGPGAVLEDVAYLGQGLLDLYEAGGAQSHLERALALAGWLVAAFVDPVSGALCDTPEGHEPLFVRPRSGHDGPFPSPNAVAARLLARLGAHADRPPWRAVSLRALAAWRGEALAHPDAFAAAALAAEQLAQDPPATVAVVRPAHLGHAWDDPTTRAIVASAAPGEALAHAAEGAPALAPGSPWPLLAGRQLVDGAATVWRCRAGTCAPPTHVA